MKVTNDLLITLDKGLVSVLVLLDLSAAYDSIDHQILLHRLENFLASKHLLLAGVSPSYQIDFNSCALTMNHPSTEKLVTEFHKVQCLDQFYSSYICFPQAILSGKTT